MRSRGKYATPSLGNMRVNGVRRGVVHCNAPHCHPSADADVDGMPDELAVLFLARRFRCPHSGSKAVSVWPAWHTTLQRGWDDSGLLCRTCWPLGRLVVDFL